MPYDAAVKVALHVKKELVDGDQLDVSQAQLEATIFRVMRKRAFGDDFISRYRMLSAFHLKRAPLVLLVVGGVCSGKTTVATKLSQVWQKTASLADSHPLYAASMRLNLPRSA